MKRQWFLALIMLVGFSSCFSWMAQDAGYHRRRVEEWDRTLQTDPVTGKKFHSGDVHNVPDYVAPRDHF